MHDHISFRTNSDELHSTSQRAGVTPRRLACFSGIQNHSVPHIECEMFHRSEKRKVEHTYLYTKNILGKHYAFSATQLKCKVLCLMNQ